MTHHDNPTVDFNLDTFRNEAETKPFVVVHDGTPYSFTHLDELDGWKAAEAFAGGEAGADIEVIKLALGDDFAKFKSAKVLRRGPMQALVKRYLAHCGIDTGN
ncbi:hypothetical protein NYO98_10440 [Nocardioides sp. STR2]|uniref:Uncharacterized protein n=1 Tax=Nocardioides pini TaxID=2975053 RepID=A0ABT4CCK9_9ACTN|nr:hypothetical protein [Nocardioides pini]MCY4726696.1 hypothetical protein [Nocardioides pini]